LIALFVWWVIRSAAVGTPITTTCLHCCYNRAIDYEKTNNQQRKDQSGFWISHFSREGGMNRMEICMKLRFNGRPFGGLKMYVGKSYKIWFFEVVDYSWGLRCLPQFNLSGIHWVDFVLCVFLMDTQWKYHHQQWSIPICALCLVQDLIVLYPFIPRCMDCAMLDEWGGGGERPIGDMKAILKVGSMGMSSKILGD
jgi:hypothetical protein